MRKRITTTSDNTDEERKDDPVEIRESDLSPPPGLHLNLVSFGGFDRPTTAQTLVKKS